MKIENLNEYKIVSPKENGLYSGSLIGEKQLRYIKTTGSQEYPFSIRPEDNIEISIYDSVTQDLISWTAFSGSVYSTQRIQSSYVDLNENLINNSYDEFISAFFVLENEGETSVIMDPESDVKLSGLQEDSPYIISYLPLSNRVGNFNRPISVKEISPSRTEVKLKYGQNANERTIQEFNNFTNNEFSINIVANNILEGIQSLRIEEIYFDIKTSRLKSISLFNTQQGLKTDLEIIDFVDRIHQGPGPLSVYYQFSNWIYKFYDKSASQQNIIDRYIEISDILIDEYLSRKSDTTTRSYEIMKSFIQDIFDTIYITSIINTISEYNLQRLEPLKSALNFGENTLYNILNIKFIGGDIVVKLDEPLEDTIEKGESCYISRLITDPHVVDYTPYNISETELVELSPVDYSKFKYNDFRKGIDYQISYDQQKRIENKVSEIRLNNLEVDYTKFENFIQFSSATYRLSVFNRKKTEIENLEDLNSSLTPTFDPYYIQEISGNLDRISEIKNSFDAYEQFLFNNSEWYTIHTEEFNGETSASLYDRDNPNNLHNNLPEYIVNDEFNDDFVKFVNVIGNHFDNIFTSINQFNQSKYPQNFGSEQLFDGAVNKMLSVLGWDSSYATNDIFLELFGEDKYGNLIESKSGVDRKKIIWKRFVNALPYILKTKGTEECIRILFSVYGVPRSLYKIREFNSIPNDSNERRNVYSFDNEYFALHYNGSAEYIQTEWSDEIQSVEFKFSFDVEQLHPAGSIFRLVSLGNNNWLIGAIRDGRDPVLGKMFFTIAEDTDDPSSIKTIVTDSIPIFDGHLYSVLLRKNDLAFDSPNTFIYEVEEGLMPRKFDLIVQRAQNDRIVIQSSASFSFGSEFCDTFRGLNTTSSMVYIGNYDQVSTSSLTPDIDAFYGVIDEVKFYNSAVSNDRFNSHTQYVDAYDIDEFQKLDSSLMLYLNFERPVDLYIGNSTESLALGYVSIENSAFNSPLTDIRAYNFPKLEDSTIIDTSGDGCIEYPEVLHYVSSSFPWHFRSFRTKEYITVPNFGSSTLNNEKIFYVSESVDSYNGTVFTDISVASDVEFGSSSPTVGLFFSPSEQLDLEILQFFGNINLGDYIGNPSDLYERTYSDFKRFRRTFFKNFNGINFNEYIKIIKNYIDSSMFKNIQRTIPARTKLKSGILIEPSILERNKIQQRPIQVDKSLTYDSVIDTKFEPVSSFESTFFNTGEIDVNFRKKGSSAFYNNLNKNYLSDAPTCVKSNDGVVIIGNKRYFAQVYKETKNVFSVNEQNEIVSSSIQVEKLNFTPLSGSSIAQVLADSDEKFGPGNYRTFLGNCPRRRPRYRRRIGSLSVQTVETTVEEPDLDDDPVPQIINPVPETPETPTDIPTIPTVPETPEEPTPVVPDVAATIYRDARYGGQSIDLAPGEEIPRLRTVNRFNDRISSLKVSPGYAVILYVDINYRGKTIRLTGNQPSLGTLGWNDRASSIRVVPVAGPGSGGPTEVETVVTPVSGVEILVDPSSPYVTIDRDRGTTIVNNILNRNTSTLGSISYSSLPYVITTGTVTNGSSPFGTSVVDPTSVVVVGTNSSGVSTQRSLHKEE